MLLAIDLTLRCLIFSIFFATNSLRTMEKIIVINVTTKPLPPTNGIFKYVTKLIINI